MLTLLASSWLCTTAAGPSGSAASVAVFLEDGTYLLSVTAREASLRALLDQVTRLVGLRIEEAAPTERTVSVEFERWPLDQALKRLLRGENFVFLSSGPREGGGSSTQGRLILFGRVPSPDARSVEVSAAGQPRSDQMVSGPGVPAQTTPEEADAFNPEAPLEQLLAFVGHKDPGIRTSVLEALVPHGDDVRARRLLLDHISDPDPEIRSLALTLVGPYVAEWPEAEDVVMRAAFDSVTSIRQLALQMLVESSSSMGAEATRLARVDQDADVRAWAEELLRKEGSNLQRHR